MKLLGLTLTIACAFAVGLVLSDATARWPLSASEAVLVVLLAALAGNGFAAGVLVLVAACGGARTLRHPGRRRALGLQVLVANALLPALLLGGILDGGTIEAELAASGWDLLLIPAAYLCAWVAWRLWRRSRRHEALAATEAMVQDPRPPVLYLRSFTDDGQVFREHGAPAWQGWSMQAIGMGSAEEMIAGILDRVGPVIAIGKPGEDLPELGAARLYVAHDAWQRRVLELMDAAALVVVRLGATPGVRWEIEQALARLPRQRLVFAIFESELAPQLVARLTELLGPDLGSALLEPVSGRFAGLARALTLGLKEQRIGSRLLRCRRPRPHGPGRASAGVALDPCAPVGAPAAAPGSARDRMAQRLRAARAVLARRCAPPLARHRGVPCARLRSVRRPLVLPGAAAARLDLHGHPAADARAAVPGPVRCLAFRLGRPRAVRIALHPAARSRPRIHKRVEPVIPAVHREVPGSRAPARPPALPPQGPHGPAAMEEPPATA